MWYCVDEKEIFLVIVVLKLECFFEVDSFFYMMFDVEIISFGNF